MSSLGLNGFLVSAYWFQWHQNTVTNITSSFFSQQDERFSEVIPELGQFRVSVHKSAVLFRQQWPVAAAICPCRRNKRIRFKNILLSVVKMRFFLAGCFFFSLLWVCGPLSNGRWIKVYLKRLFLRSHLDQGKYFYIHLNLASDWGPLLSVEKASFSDWTQSWVQFWQELRRWRPLSSWWLWR